MINSELLEVFRECEETAAWIDIKVTDVNQVNHLGDTPLHTVCSWGELKFVKALLESGANVNAKGDGDYTPLMKSVSGGNLAVIRYLLQKGAKKDLKTDRGFTAHGLAELVGSCKHIREALK